MLGIMGWLEWWAVVIGRCGINDVKERIETVEFYDMFDQQLMPN